MLFLHINTFVQLFANEGNACLVGAQQKLYRSYSRDPEPWDQWEAVGQINLANFVFMKFHSLVLEIKLDLLTWIGDEAGS